MEKEIEEIESAGLRFPNQFRSVEDVFQFSYDAMVDVSGEFEPETDISVLLEDLQTFLSSGEDQEDDTDDLRGLVEEELEIISFSNSSRCSIIDL